MKARLLLLFIPILFMVTACSKSYVNPNQTVIADVGANKWSSSDGGKTYATFISMPEIDSYNNAYAGILVYASFDGGNTYEQIPEVYNGIAYSFTHKVGQVEIDIQASNGTSVITPPGGVRIKIVVIPSNL